MINYWHFNIISVTLLMHNISLYIFFGRGSSLLLGSWFCLWGFLEVRICSALNYLLNTKLSLDFSQVFPIILSPNFKLSSFPDNAIFTDITLGSRRTWPVSRGCLLLIGTLCFVLIFVINREWKSSFQFPQLTGKRTVIDDIYAKITEINSVRVK